jgi:hypothetical protein
MHPGWVGHVAVGVAGRSVRQRKRLGFDGQRQRQRFLDHVAVRDAGLGQLDVRIRLLDRFGFLDRQRLGFGTLSDINRH